MSADSIGWVGGDCYSMSADSIGWVGGDCYSMTADSIGWVGGDCYSMSCVSGYFSLVRSSEGKMLFDVIHFCIFPVTMAC